MVSFRARVEAKAPMRRYPRSNLQRPTAKAQTRWAFVRGCSKLDVSALRRLFFITVLACIVTTRAGAADTNAVLNGWLAAQTNLQTWSADFTQIRSLKTLTQPLVATGHLWLAMPNRFRWELQSPSQTIALRAAEEMWVIYPKLKRAERYPINAK